MQRNHWMIGSTQESGDNLVVSITISSNVSFLGYKLISLN
jgi:hypothetical protein